MIIPLVPLLPAGSSDLPESSDGPPSDALLFGLAPDGACLAPDVATETGELLPHRFTLTPPVGGAVCFLLRFPARHRDWTLSSTLPCGARTFLRSRRDQRSFALLQFPNFYIISLCNEQKGPPEKCLCQQIWGTHNGSSRNSVFYVPRSC